MRWRSVVLAALLLTTLPTGAQTASEPLLEDASGDESMSVAGSPMTPPGGRHGPLDLRSLAWNEEPEAFGFVLGLRDTSASAESNPLDQVRYFIGFTFEDVDYGIQVYRFVGLGGEVFHDAYMGPRYDDGEYRSIDHEDYVEITVDDEASTLTGTIRRQSIIDSEGAPAALGDVFKDFFVEAQSLSIVLIRGTDTSTAVTDRMPDDGMAGVFEATFGIVQDGDARLGSQAPFRLSNGGATSMVYEVDAANLGQKQSFRLAATAVPAGWEVALPFDRLVLDEGEQRTFPILVTTPSGHKHGGVDKFLITMTGERDGRHVGRAELGVKYTTIPQPAGHHPTLYLHSHRPWGEPPVAAAEDISPGLLFGPAQGYLNAAPPEDDPGDTQEAMPSYSSIIPGFGWFSWHMPLLPTLGMGLDFDTQKTATLSLPISYGYVAQDVEITATLYYAGGRDNMVVAHTLPTQPLSFGPQASQTIELTLEIDKDADFIPYQPEAWMELSIDMEGIFAGPNVGPGSVPSIEPGGKLDLPLLEYHDRVERFYGAIESLRFDKEYLEKPVNPSKTVVFETRLRNDGTQTEPIALNLTGTNAQWARLLGPAAFDLRAGQERAIAVAVAVPDGTPDGALADLVLQAVSERETFRRAIIEFIAIVDEEADHPDESDRVSTLDEKLDDKKSPGFELAAVALGMLAIALVLRRRR